MVSCALDSDRRQKPIVCPTSEPSSGTHGHRGPAQRPLVSLHQVNGEDVEEAAQPPLELLFGVKLHDILRKNPFLHEIQHLLADNAKASHGFVQRHILFATQFAEMLVFLSEVFFVAGGQPMAQVLQQDLSPFMQFGLGEPADMGHLWFAADLADHP
ncbi:hypothetical protein SBA6_830003 [Candidatus Sulfopaludibacter sp. SbA6]|nr:hypothetical protein SBA6_830003 [Candidatus Sulfopaludibacter sp. SbA6]